MILLSLRLSKLAVHKIPYNELNLNDKNNTSIMNVRGDYIT